MQSLSYTGCINLEIVVPPIAMEAKDNYLFRIVLIGDSGVGKTSIVKQYIEGKFTCKGSATYGVDFGIKSLQIGSSEVKVIPCLVNRTTSSSFSFPGFPTIQFLIASSSPSPSYLVHFEKS